MRKDEQGIEGAVAARHPRWVRAVCGFAAATVLACCCALGATAERPARSATLAAKASPPNIVFVLTDDLSSNLVRYMPHVRKMMRQGATFTNYYVTNSLCCPSRSSIFTGLYPHSSGVRTNVEPDGGMAAFNEHGNTGRTFAVALQGRGYHTALMGKYLNGYEPDLQIGSSLPYVPRGWDEWAAGGDDAYRSFDYTLNQNHQVVHYGRAPHDYLTDVLGRLAHDFIARAVPAGGAGPPFALEVATIAPHLPYVPAPRDRSRFGHVRAPRTPAFGRHDRKGIPRWLDLRDLTRTAIKAIDGAFRLRVRTVQAVDRMVGALRRQLRKKGLASNTYFVFSSDNGYHLGEHRMRSGKLTAFDTDIRVPLVIVGPGIRPGMRIGALAANIDLAPTFEDLAGYTPSPAVEGRSLVALLEGRQPARWRRAVLVEHRGPVADPADPDFKGNAGVNPPSYKAMRLRRALYVEYVTGEREYYDLAEDPYELHNAYADLGRRRRADLHEHMVRLASCHSAAGCHRADRLPPRS